jgi:hypothetical protein
MRNKQAVGMVIIDVFTVVDSRFKAVREKCVTLDIQYINVQGNVLFASGKSTLRSDWCSSLVITRSLYSLTKEDIRAVYEKVISIGK